MCGAELCGFLSRVSLRILVELLAASGGAKIVGFAPVFAGVDGLRGFYGHPANGVFTHIGLTSQIACGTGSNALRWASSGPVMRNKTTQWQVLFPVNYDWTGK